MHCCNIPAKQTYGVIITATNILWEINYINRIIYRIPTGYTIAHSTSITVVRKIYFTVIVCVMCFIFLHKAIILKPVFILLSNKE